MNKFPGFYSLLKHLVGARRAQYTDYGTVRVTGNGGLILGKARDFFLFCSVCRPAVGHSSVYSGVCFSWGEVVKVMKLNTDLCLMPKVRVYGTVLPLAPLLLWHGTYLTLCYTPHTYVDFLQWFFFFSDTHASFLHCVCFVVPEHALESVSV